MVGQVRARRAVVACASLAGVVGLALTTLTGPAGDTAAADAVLPGRPAVAGSVTAAQQAAAAPLATAAAVQDRPVLVVGDSLSHQAADEIVEAFHAAGYSDVELAVFGGTTIGWGTDRVLERPSRPIVVFSSGTYNLLEGWSADDQAQAERAVSVLDERACAIWVVPAARPANRQVRLALQGSGVHTAEWDVVSQALPEIHAADGIHNTEEGQRLYGQLMADSARTRCGPVDPATVEGNRRYVEATHDTFLGRAPTASESELWTGRLTFGFPRLAFTRTFATSAEWVDRQVDAVYRQALGRAADPTGLAYWRGLIRSGTPLSSVVVELFASDERWARSGSTATGWVTGLYRTLLHRDPDDAGLRHWTGLLGAGVPRRVIARDFHDSLESRRDRVTGLYRSVLGREPDAAGRDHWAGALLAIDDVRVAAVLAASDEFFARSQRV